MQQKEEKISKVYENKYVLYFHKNPLTDVVFYVGIGLAKRPMDFYCRSTYWKNYVRKNGEPIIEVYRTNLNRFEASHLETHFIKYFGRKAIDANGVLVNLTLGGEGRLGYSVPHTESTKIKIGNIHKGKNVSQQSRDKMSQSHKLLKKLNKEVIHNITGAVYSSITEASKAENVSVRVMSAMLRGKVKSREGEFSYLISSDKENKINSGKYIRSKRVSDQTRAKMRNRPTYQSKKVKDNNTGVIYNSIKEACDVLQIRHSTLAHGLRNGVKSRLHNISYCHE